METQEYNGWTVSNPPHKEGRVMRKYKTPSYIRPCDKCGQGKGYHSESVDYRLCDTCFRAKCDDQLSEYLARGGN